MPTKIVINPLTRQPIQPKRGNGLNGQNQPYSSQPGGKVIINPTQRKPINAK